MIFLIQARIYHLNEKILLKEIDVVVKIECFLPIQKLYNNANINQSKSSESIGY